MGAASPRGNGAITDINITPFVDVVLVLLIIFMVTAPTMFSSQLPLELPSATTGETPPASELGIAIAKDGSLLVNGQPTTRSELAARAAQNPAGTTALISADRATPHGVVVDVLDLLRAAGVEKYAINVVPDDSR